jgi:hypothetical protein
MGERRQQFRELRRLFAARFVENDLICVDGDTRGTLIGVLSLLIAPGVFLPMLEYIRFGSAPLCFQSWMARDLAAIPDKTIHLALSMTVLGLFTVFEWDAMLPDRRDLTVLRPFPVGLGALFAAKIFALLQFWTIFTLAIDGISGVFFPVAVVQNAPSGVLLRYVGAHAAALVAANLFMFLLMIAIQGLLMTLLGPARFRRFGSYAQFVLIAGLLSLFFLSIGVVFGLRTDQPPSPVIQSLPVYWFLGLDQVLLGWKQPLFDGLAPQAGLAIVGALLAAAAAYTLSYRRTVHRLFEAQDGPAARPGHIARWAVNVTAVRLLRSPGERASFFFVWHTVTRSRSHRLLVAAWTAAGLALVVQGITGAVASGAHEWWLNIAGPLLPVPIVLPLFLITGLRHAFSVPAELRGNWIFQMGCATPQEYLAGARKAALVLALPPLMALLPLFIVTWGWQFGGLHVLFGMIVAWLLVETAMTGLQKLPFTCSYVPGKANVRSCWTLYVLAYLAYIGLLSWLDLKILEQPARMLWFLAAAFGVRIGIERYRRAQIACDDRLVFDERPAPAVVTLELGV